MRHHHLIEGAAYRLRPVVCADAHFIAALRSDPVHCRWLHPTANDPAAQRRWIDTYEQRDGDVYFVVECKRTVRAEGLVGVYDITSATDGSRTAEWGRWVLRAGSTAAVESAWLVYRAAFEALKLDSVFCRTVAANTNVVSFHDSCGLSSRRLLPAHVQLHQQWHDSIEHRLERADWPAVGLRLGTLAQRMQARARTQRQPAHA